MRLREHLHNLYTSINHQITVSQYSEFRCSYVWDGVRCLMPLDPVELTIVHVWCPWIQPNWSNQIADILRCGVKLLLCHRTAVASYSSAPAHILSVRKRLLQLSCLGKLLAVLLLKTATQQSQVAMRRRRIASGASFVYRRWRDALLNINVVREDDCFCDGPKGSSNPQFVWWVRSVERHGRRENDTSSAK